MATTYICKCGRQVRKSTNADTTGNRDTENCKGCPYLLPWGPTQWDAARHAMVTDVKGYECRMSKDIEYATRFCGSIDDKCSCYIASLDFDFLTRVSNWIKETYPGGELNGSFFTDDIRAYVSNGRYRMSISCAQNKKGIAAKAALLHQFFDASGARLDMTPEEEKAHVLAAIEAGKAQAQKKEDKTLMYKDPVTGWLYRVSPNPINDKGLYELEYLDQQNSTIWKPDVYWNTNAVYRDQEHLQEALDDRARRDGWELVEDVPAENPTPAAPASPVDAGAAAQSLSDAGSASLAAENVFPVMDFGADVATNAELLQCAQTFVIGKVAQVMAAKRAHDLTANNKNGAFGKWCAAVGISRDKGNQLVNIADNFGNIELEGKPLIEVAPISLLALGAKPSTPDVLTEGIGKGEITTIKQFKELEAQLKAVQTERDEARKAKEKAEQERDAARDAQVNLSAMANKFSKQRDAAEQRVEDAEHRAEEAERRARAAEEDAAGWKQAGLEMQELVDQRDERIRELESGITVETTAADQEEIERRANELSETLVKIIDQQDEQIKRMASGNTVSAQASVLEQYLETMKTSLLDNARRAELAFYDVGALDSLAQALREFADEIDGVFEEGEENEDQQD